MSSNHTYICERKWERMQREAREAASYVIRREEEARAVAQEADRIMREIANAHTVSTEALDAAVAAMTEAYRSTLQNVRGQFAGDVARQSTEFSNQFQSMLEQIRSTSGRISRSDSRLDDLAARYDEAFQAMNAQTASREARAQQILQEVDRLLEQIGALNPTQFMPVEYAALQRLRSDIHNNLRVGDPQAAILASQSGVLTASRMLAQLMVVNQNHQRQLTEARTAAAQVQRRMNELTAGSGVIHIEVDGESMDMPYDIVYWSNGAFDALRNRLAAATERLNNRALTPRELENLRTEIENIRIELERCDQVSRTHMTESVFVEETAIRLHNNLTARGWHLVEGQHHNNETREPYTLRYEDGDGNIMCIVVSPGERNDTPVYAVEVFSDNHYRAGIIKDGVHAAMEQDGMIVRDIERRDDCHLNPDPETFQRNMVREAQQRRQARRQNRT